MATVYLGNNKNHISQIYYGGSKYPRRIIKGYIGLDNIPHLFFSPGSDIDLQKLKGYSYAWGEGAVVDHNFISNIRYESDYTFSSLPSNYKDTKYIIHNYNNYSWAESRNKFCYYEKYSSLDTDPDEYVEDEEEEFVDRGGILYVANSVRYVYLNEDSSYLFNTYTGYLHEETGVSYDLTNESFQKIRFDKVKNLCGAFNGYYWDFSLDSLKYFNNVENLYEAFYGCAEITGSPIIAPKAINMVNCYAETLSISGDIYIGPYVTNAANCFSQSGVLNLAKKMVGVYGPINLSNCFNGTNVQGALYINSYNTSSVTTNLNGIFYNRIGKKRINVFMPSTKTLSQLNTFLKPFIIYNSSEKHVINTEGGYVDIQNSSKVTYNIRFYNYIPN